MKIKTFSLFLALVLLAAAGGAIAAASSPPAAPRVPHQVQGPIIVDHTCTDLSQVPEYWIDRAKSQLRISYGHTSHGSQPVYGMQVLMDDPSYNGLYDFNRNGAIQIDVLSLSDYTPSGDLGNPDRTTWAARTREYLDGSGSDRNVVIWSWCGQADTSEENIDLYLNLMNELETDYPQVTFVYMTGHLNGTGVDGNLNQRNEQIREYCIANNKILFDFADIESYDPDGNYYLDRGADDGCNYDGGNWADEWCAAHSEDPLCATCSCAHSRPLNCNLKARAFWWMFARIAGWEGQAPAQADLSPSYKTVSPAYAQAGGRVAYTVVVQSAAGPVTSTLTFHDTLPEDLIYVPGSLSATAGTVNETNAPTLRWSGVLTPTPVVTITYAATVTYVTSGTGSLTLIVPRAISNMATITAPGHDPITRTATLRVDWMHLYLPAVLK